MFADVGDSSPAVEPGKGQDERCSACGGDRAIQLGEKNHYRLWKCRRCGSIYTKSWAGEKGPESDDIQDLYEHYYDRARFETHPVAAASYDRLVRSFERYRSSGRWLDVGYGEGGLLEVAAQHGWACYGLEVSPSALQYAERRGWLVATDIEDDARFPRRGFDVVTMMECLEHVTDPRHFLVNAARLLRPGGLLHLTTPNARSLNYRLLGLNWSVVSPPEHLTLWTVQALRDAVRALGFLHPSIRAVGFNPFDLRSRLLPGSRKEAGGGRTDTAFALNTAFSRNALRRMAKDLINSGLSLSGTGDTLKLWAELTGAASKCETSHE